MIKKIHIFIKQVWDEADYVVPPAENGAFFVTTNVVITPNQTWGECPEVGHQIFYMVDTKLYSACQFIQSNNLRIIWQQKVTNVLQR